MKHTTSAFFVLLCAMIFALSSCTINPNVQGKGEVFLQGVWQEDSIKFEDQLLEFTKHKFTFTCDSFYVTFTTTAKLNKYTDSCFNGGQWKEYAKGVYAFKNDSLFLSGTFTKPNFRQKTSGCYRIGQYLPFFIVKEHTAKKLIFQDDHGAHELNLKQKIVCNPKSL